MFVIKGRIHGNTINENQIMRKRNFLKDREEGLDMKSK
jgi:hypothetical protein